MRKCGKFVAVVIITAAFFTLAVTFVEAVGGEATAPKVTDGMVIDGDLSEWNKSSPITIDSEGQVIRDANLWDGPSDLSAKVYLMWDESNLYVGAEITDETPLQFRSMGIDSSDSVVLYFSTNPASDPSRVKYESTDFRLLLATTDYEVVTGIDRNMVENKKGIETANLSGAGGNVLTGYERGVKETVGGCIFEAKVPWSNFSNENIPLFTSEMGDEIGFDLVLNDMDIPCPGVSGPAMAWLGDESIKTSPSGWGTLVFGPGGVANVAPTAGFGYSPLSPTVGETIQFTDQSSDLNGEIVAWSWDFDNDGVEDSTKQNPSHSYDNAGVYTVTLTVTDNNGLTNVVSKTVGVTGPKSAGLPIVPIVAGVGAVIVLVAVVLVLRH